MVNERQSLTRLEAFCTIAQYHNSGSWLTSHVVSYCNNAFKMGDKKVWNPKPQSSHTSRVLYAWEDTLTNNRPTWYGYVTRLKRAPTISETWNKNENSQEEDYGQKHNELWMTSHERKEKHERKMMMMILWNRDRWRRLTARQPTLRRIHKTDLYPCQMQLESLKR